MNFKIIISTEAKKQTLDAFNYYENKQENLGEIFLQTIESLYLKLQKSPYNYSFLSSQKDLRYTSISTFPFIIIFEILEDVVYIINVHNTHQARK